MLSPGTIVSGYRVDGVLGEGGMGVVYRATQLSLNRTVALKILATDLTEDDAFRERFRREGLLQAAIDHQHIVTVYEAGETEHGLFLAMRLIRGPTLKSMIFAGELDPPRTLRILTQVAGALDAAHDVGLTHRDIKPQNILIGSDDHAYLADFGLTRASDEVSLTETGQFIGTIDYVAPEQIQGMGGTAESDVYSLTAVLYEALTGVVPFLRMNEAAVLFAHIAETAPPATERNSDLPPEIDAVIARGMAKIPEDRYASAGDLIADAVVAFGEDALAATSHAPPVPPPTAHPPEAAGAGERTQTRETLSGAEAAMASTAARPTIPLPPEPAPAEPPALLAKHTTRELLKLRAAITRELLRRDEVHAADDPIGDIAEALVTEHYGGEGHGQRLEVKGIRPTGSRTGADLSPIPATSTYTDVVIVVFDDDLRVTEALRMPRSAVERLFLPRKKDGARVIRLSKKLRDDVDVVPIEISDALLDS